MTQTQAFDFALTAVGGGGIATFFYWVKGGFRQARSENIKTIVEAVENAGAMLAKSNENLRLDIKQLTVEYEHKIDALSKKFELKEQQLKLEIDNLKLENKNLKLENANLLLENERLSKHKVRRINE